MHIPLHRINNLTSKGLFVIVALLTENKSAVGLCLLILSGAIAFGLLILSFNSETIFTVPSLLTENVLQAPLSLFQLVLGVMGTVLLVSLFAGSTVGALLILSTQVIISVVFLSALHLIFGTVLPIAFGLIVKALGYLFAGVMSSPFFYLAVTFILGALLILSTQVMAAQQSSTDPLLSIVNYSPVSSDPVSHTDSVKITEVATTNKTCTKRTKDAVSAVLNDNGSFLLSASVDNGILTIVSKAKAKPKGEADNSDDTDEDSS
jgi:hypothetical protein